LGCGPYYDSISGELVTSNPEINFPDVIPICSNELPLTYSSTDTADGFRWFKINQFENETLISDTAEVEFTEDGAYRYEAYNTVSQSGNMTECPTSKNFRVEVSGIATINNIQVSQQLSAFRVEINAEGNGDYEFGLNKDGPYQPSNIFENVPQGQITAYVRDKNGCGIAEKTVEHDFDVEGFPKFFTPNGDGFNDFWQFIPSELNRITDLKTIYIFNRFGLFIGQIDPTSLGWDGRFRGKPLPESDYWFKAITNENIEVKGHFSLKR
jgi:gliding motility-associated-like protein